MKIAVLKLNPDILLGNKIGLDLNVLVDIRYGGQIILEDGVQLYDHAKLITYGGNIKIGRRTKVNAFTVICGHGNVCIGENVLIGPHCMIIPSNHVFERIDIPFVDQGETKKGIVIGNNVWIANGCTILDGVTIGDNVVIGAGSVVNKDIESGVIAVGTPAKVLRRI